jgi:hypothetical protein
LYKITLGKYLKFKTRAIIKFKIGPIARHRITYLPLKPLLLSVLIMFPPRICRVERVFLDFLPFMNCKYEINFREIKDAAAKKLRVVDYIVRGNRKATGSESCAQWPVSIRHVWPSEDISVSVSDG